MSVPVSVPWRRAPWLPVTYSRVFAQAALAPGWGCRARGDTGREFFEGAYGNVVADLEALRTGWDCSQAEDRRSDRSDVGCVAMQPPDHESLQPSSLSLECHKIADARFVESSAVVDHQHLARCRSFERLQEDIDAADMLSWTHTPS